MEDTPYSNDRQPSLKFSTSTPRRRIFKDNHITNPTDGSADPAVQVAAPNATLAAALWTSLPLGFMMLKTLLRPHEETSGSRSPTFLRYVSVVV